MVKLPDVQSFGESPAPQSRAPILVPSNPGVAERAAQQTSPGIDRALAQTMSVIDKQATLQESSDRLRALREFREKANTETNRVLTQEDIASPQVTQAYGAYMSQLERDVLKSHGGRPESMAKLGELIFSTKTNLVENVATKGAEALYKKSVAELGDEANAGAQRISSNPDTWRNEWASFSTIADDQAMSPESRRTQKGATLGHYAETAATSYLLQGKTDAAEDILGDPEVARAMPEARRTRLLKAIATANKPRDPVKLGEGDVLVDPGSGRTIAQGRAKTEAPLTVSPGQVVIDRNGREIFRAPDKQTKENTITLSPGEKAYDSKGNLLVSNDDKKDKTFTLSPGQVVKDAAGNTLAEAPAKDDRTDILKEADDLGLEGDAREKFIRDYRNKPGITIDQRGESSFVGEIGRLSAKSVGDFNDDAHRAISDLTEISRAQEALDTGQAPMGTFAEYRVEIARFMELAGVPREIIKEVGDAPTAEVFDSAMKRLALNEIPKMARTLVAGLKLVQESLPRLSYTDQGNKVLLAVFKRMANRRVQIAKLANNITADESVSTRKFQGELLNAIEELEKKDPVINAEMAAMIREGTKDAPKSIAERFPNIAGGAKPPEGVTIPAGYTFSRMQDGKVVVKDRNGKEHIQQ